MITQLLPDGGERRWHERANCLGVDPDLFFPERGASTREAKAVCGTDYATATAAPSDAQIPPALFTAGCLAG